MTDRIREQRLETASQAVWKMLSIAEVLGSPRIDPATIHMAALAPLSSLAAGLAEKLANFTLANVEMLALLLAGQYKEGAIADFEAIIRSAGGRRPDFALEPVAPDRWPRRPPSSRPWC